MNLNEQGGIQERLVVASRPIWQTSLMSVTHAFDANFLSRMATPNSLSRGKTYARGERVVLDLLTDQQVDARVKGTSTYRVSLSTVSGKLSWGCECPAADGGQFCKHCVAVAMVASNPGAATGDPEEAAITVFLSTLAPKELLSIISGQAKKDERFASALLASAQLSTGDTPNLAEWKKKVTKAYGRGFIDYRHAQDWAAEVHDALGAINDLAEAGHHETAALLAEHAHKRTETAAGRVDDSDGCITVIFNEIRQIHTSACLGGAFPPKKLAQRLVKLELAAELDTFHRSAISHAEALGSDGLAEYGRLVEAAYAKVPPETARWGEGFRVNQARIAHAIATNDPDQLISVMGDDLTSPHDYVEVVDAMDRAGRIDEALSWADKGLDKTSERIHQQPALMAARARILRTLGQHDKIDQMYWALFKSRPDASTFATLMANAADPDDAKARAVDHVLDQLSDRTEPEIGRTGMSALLGDIGWSDGAVGILLDAGEDELAWDTAIHHFASNAEWDRLAELRKESSPLDTITIWEQQAERYIQQKKKADYRRAAKILARIEKLASSCDRPDLYVEALLGVRSRHKNKPSLMKILG